MKKLTNIEKVRQYDLRNGQTTARQAASDLDLTPQQVYQIRYQLSRKANKIEVPKEWEEDAQAMKMEMRNTQWARVDVNTPAEVRVSVREANALADQAVNANIKCIRLESELAQAKIIIKYLEGRLHEEINGQGSGNQAR